MRILSGRPTGPIWEQRGPVACLLLHGHAGSPAELRPLADYLVTAGITVMAPVLPGHGSEAAPLSSVNWQDWAGASTAALERLSTVFGRVHVVGFSMGALLALHLSAQRDVASVTALAAPMWVPETAHPGLIGLLERVRADLPAVKAPLLAVFGDRDPKATPASAAYLANHVGSRRQETVCLPGRKHMITLEPGREAVFRRTHAWVMEFSGNHSEW